MCYPFYTINVNDPDIEEGTDKYSFANVPFRWYRPMNSVRIPKLDSTGTKWLHGYPEYFEGGYGRFPQFGGDQTGAVAPITPLFNNSEVAWIKVEDVQLLDPSKPIPSPFNM